MSHPETPPLAFDDFVIDFAGRRLLRDGVTVPLEPKAFAVLALLASSAGQAFGRDDILNAVWGHTHVTPGVLNRIVTLLRHALGEDAHAPRFLRTLHGVGYRFDLAATAASHELELLPDAPLAVLRPEQTAVPPTAPASTQPKRLAAKAAFGYVLAVAALMGIGGVLIWQRSTPAPTVAQRQTTTPTLVVLPLTAIDPAVDSQLAAGLSEELIGTLATIRGLRVIAQDSTTRAAATSPARAQLVQQLAVSHILEGSVRQAGGQMRVSVRLVEAASGHLIWSQDFDRSAGDLFVVQDNIAGAVAASLQLQLQVGATPLASRHEDPTLYRRYLLAASLMPSATTTPVAAESGLRSLVAEHPDYARGWGGLAFLLWTRAAIPGPGRDALRAEAESAAAMALTLDPNQADALAVHGGQACREQRWEDCLALISAAVEQSPSRIQWRLLLARQWASMGYLDAALKELDAVQALDPMSPTLQFHRGRVLDALGRHDEARHALLLADPAFALTALFYNAAWRGDAAEMRRIAGSLTTATPWRESALAAADAITDPSRWPQVEALAEANEPRLRSQGAVPYDFSRILLPQRDFARDIAGLDQVQRQGYATYQWIFWQPESRDLRKDPAFATYLRQSGLLAYWRKHGFPAQCHASGDGASCD